MLNVYEETQIAIPGEWQSAVGELEQFLEANWELRSVFYEDGDITSIQQFLSFAGQGKIRTGRYIGTIAFKGQQLNIFPKVFKPAANDYDTQDLSLPLLMKNLTEWLNYCSRFNYPYINIKSEFEDTNDLRGLFVSLYIRYVKNALEHGLFYQYEDKTEDGGAIRGQIDIRDYALNKIPRGMADRFLCTYSSFEFDNRLNRIIKYTCKLLHSEVYGENRRILRHILLRLGEAADVRCKPSDCDAVQLSPLHGNYRVILGMSKMFLLNQTASYMPDVNESFCFLFPAEYLFEGFIGGFMQGLLRGRARVRLQASEVSLVDDIVIEGQSHGRAFTMRHDILVEHGDKVFIFDAKYKEISRLKGNPSVAREASQADLYQVFAYAARRGVGDVYLLYPMFRLEDEEDSAARLVIPFAEREVNVHIVRLPFVFGDDAEVTRARLASVLEAIFSSQSQTPEVTAPHTPHQRQGS